MSMSVGRETVEGLTVEGLTHVHVCWQGDGGGVDPSEAGVLLQELWQDHYTETYWFYYNSFSAWLTTTGATGEDYQGDAYFANSGHDLEFVLAPSADQPNDGEGRVDT